MLPRVLAIARFLSVCPSVSVASRWRGVDVHGYLSRATCRLFAYGPAGATAVPKPHRLLPDLNPDWFYLSGSGLPRFTGKEALNLCSSSKKVKVAHTRLPSVGFRSWSRFLAVSLQVTWVINPPVGCHYFPPGLHLPPQVLRGLLPILLLGEQRHNGCEQFA